MFLSLLFAAPICVAGLASDLYVRCAAVARLYLARWRGLDQRRRA